MTNKDKIQAIKENFASDQAPVPQSVLVDVFSDWVKGETDDMELVNHLLPLEDQPMLLRLQILAQAVNLGQTLLQEAERSLLTEEGSIVEAMEQLDEQYEMDPSPSLEAAQGALQLYLQALHALQENLAHPEPQLILHSLEMGQEAAIRLNDACRAA